MPKPDKSRETIPADFETGFFLKGIDGLPEIAAGAFLTFLKPQRANRLIYFLTQHALCQIPGTWPRKLFDYAVWRNLSDDSRNHKTDLGSDDTFRRSHGLTDK